MKYPIITLYIFAVFIYSYSDQGFAWSNEFALVDQEIAISTTFSPSQKEIFQVISSTINSIVTFICYVPDNSKTKKLQIYNLQGKLIKTFYILQSGVQHITWDGKDRQGRVLSPGIYIVQFETDRNAVSKNILYVK